ncbi:hypothetical protein COLO4_05112 [Corchorus olitorius]|uniref:Uncharacterized protein n=1 Tax=Corchorus olitorius TaxID=93759 RepID=A0A1R3KRT9_9ROSI|nr:hypothetical protein COLO4_05112 [Corchorus olitorius]
MDAVKFYFLLGGPGLTPQSNQPGGGEVLDRVTEVGRRKLEYETFSQAEFVTVCEWITGQESDIEIRLMLVRFLAAINFEYKITRTKNDLHATPLAEPTFETTYNLLITQPRPLLFDPALTKSEPYPDLPFLDNQAN